MIVKLLTEHHLEFLMLKQCCRGSSEPTLVKMSNCWKSHAVAHILLGINDFKRQNKCCLTVIYGTKLCTNFSIFLLNLCNHIFNLLLFAQKHSIYVVLESNVLLYLYFNKMIP